MQIQDALYQYGFYVIDDFLNINDCNLLIDTIKNIKNDGHFKKARIGDKLNKNFNLKIRNDEIFWLDDYKDNEAISAYFYKIKELAEILNQSLFLSINDYEAHFAVYEADGFYKKHVDQFATNSDRRISCVYYLNDDWREEDGGELAIYNKSDELLTKILPFKNRFVCFTSDLPHEVSTTSRRRFSIATWLKVRPMASSINI